MQPIQDYPEDHQVKDDQDGFDAKDVRRHACRRRKPLHRCPKHQLADRRVNRRVLVEMDSFDDGVVALTSDREID